MLLFFKQDANSFLYISMISLLFFNFVVSGVGVRIVTFVICFLKVIWILVMITQQIIIHEIPFPRELIEIMLNLCRWWKLHVKSHFKRPTFKASITTPNASISMLRVSNTVFLLSMIRLHTRNDTTCGVDANKTHSNSLFVCPSKGIFCA